MAEPYTLTIAQAADQIARRELSPVTLATSLLDRIDALEPVLKAWVAIDREEVLRAALQREQEVEGRGPRGPVHGVPVGLKTVTSCNCPVRAARFPVMVFQLMPPSVVW